MIKQVLLYGSRLRQNMQLWQAMPALFVQLLGDLFNRGGFEICTAFHYHDSQRAIDYQGEFRTLLQIDGDVLNFVPPPLLFSDPQWQQQYRLHYQQHCAELSRFNQSITLLPWLVQRVAALISLGLSTLAWTQQDFIAQMDFSPWLFILVLLGAILISALLFALLLNRVIRPLLLLWLRRQWRTLI